MNGGEGENGSAFGFVETTGFVVEGVEVDVDVDMWFLATNVGCFGGFEEGAGEVFEGIGPTL